MSTFTLTHRLGQPNIDPGDTIRMAEAILARCLECGYDVESLPTIRTTVMNVLAHDSRYETTISKIAHDEVFLKGRVGKKFQLDDRDESPTILNEIPYKVFTTLNVSKWIHHSHVLVVMNNLIVWSYLDDRSQLHIRLISMDKLRGTRTIPNTKIKLTKYIENALIYHYGGVN